MKRPKLQSATSVKKFTDAIAGYAFELDRWIELNVEAFPSDPKAREERRKKVRDPKNGYRYFVETYLPHYVKGEASLFHEDVFKKVPKIIANSKGCRELFVAHRGSSKSTHISLGFVIYCLVCEIKNFPLIASDVYSQVVLLVEAIKAELTSNPRLQNDFPEACGEGRVWREGEIITRNNIRLKGVGSGQKVRGLRHGPHRPDLFIFDDLENDETVRSPEQRDKLENWLDRAALEVGPPDGSMDALYVGTILHFDAVLARKSRSPAWNTTQFPAIIVFPDNMDMWDKFEEVYHNDGPTIAERFYLKNKKEMDKGAVINWPSVQPLLFLMTKRAGSHSSFATEYQNSPIADGNPFGSLTYWKQTKPKLLHFGAIDPSLGKKGHGRDPSAILIGGLDPVTGVMDLLVASIRRRLPDIIIADTIALQKEYKCHLWFVEAVQFQEFLRTSLMKEAIKAGVALPALPIIPHADKDLRIERLQPPTAAGLIRFNSTQTTMIEQLQQWPNAPYDDGPDCLDMLWQNAVHYSKGANNGGGGIATAGSSSSGGSLRGYRL